MCASNLEKGKDLLCGIGFTHQSPMLSKMPNNSFSDPESTCRLKRKQKVRELITSNAVAESLAFTREAPPLLPNNPLHKVFLKTLIVSLYAAAEECDAAMIINTVSNFPLTGDIASVPLSTDVLAWLYIDWLHPAQSWSR